MAPFTLSFLLGAAVLGQQLGIAAAHPFDRDQSRDTGSGSRIVRRADNKRLGEGPHGHYWTKLTIGSAGQQANVMIDTGAHDLILNPSKMPSGDSSVATSGTPCSERYGGRVQPQSGSVASGPYSVFGMSASSSQFCSVALNSGIDGVLGLGFVRPAGGPGVSSQTQQNPLTQLGLDGFGVHLSATQGGGGAFTPNAYDASFFAGGAQLVSEPVDAATGFWRFPVQGNITHAGQSYALGKQYAFVDTGALTIRVPKAVASQIWQASGADTSGSYGTNCTPSGDPITITGASGNVYDIPASIYVMKSPKADGTCINAFRPMLNENRPAITLGAPFVRAFYTYFDVKNKQLQFAKSAG